MKRPIIFGIVGGLALLTLYFIVLTAISGWRFAWIQFDDTWQWIIALAAGFGVQIGLYTRLRTRHRAASGKIVAVSGTTSTVAMISCCAHYAVNILPFLGTTSLVTFAGIYQTELFLVGIFSNLAGIIYLLHKANIIRFEYVTSR